MNIYAIIILITMLTGYLLDLITNWLNIKHLKLELPGEFEETYDQKAYKNSQSYTRVYTKFGYLTSTFSLVLTLVFWFSGGFNYLDLIVRNWELGAIGTGLAYMAILVILKSVFSLPFSIYTTFVIEEKFGFNKTTPKTFILDILKGLFLGVLLGGPLLAGLLYFFQSLGSYAWVYAWIATTLFSLIVQFIAPTWIMPLFNKFIPLEAGESKKRHTRICKKIKISLKRCLCDGWFKTIQQIECFFYRFWQK